MRGVNSMGLLRETATGKTLLLEPEHVVGRALTCTLRLRPGYVSSQHALLRWVDPHWEVKDLASSNGTFVDGRRLEHGQPAAAPLGSKIAFGHPDEQWELVDASAPQVMVVPVDGGEHVVVDGELLALPSAEDPCATIYRGPGGVWILEQEHESAVPLSNLQIFSAGGRWWRFCCTESLQATSRFMDPSEMVLRNLELSFAVSRDESFVKLGVRAGERTLDLGARACNYLLLTLARQRLADGRAGLPDTSCGWVYLADLARGLETAPTQINIDVYRLRKNFAAAGVADAVGVIERRPPTRQLRIGTDKVAITLL
jgi:FHA domain-containing protein